MTSHVPPSSHSPRSPDLSLNLGGIRMKNPVMVASGTFGYGPEYASLVNLDRLGAIVVKGICLQPTKGNPPPRTVEVASGLINAIGLPGPGVDGFVVDYMPFLRGYDLPVIVNIWGRTTEEYAEVARRLSEVPGIAGLEVNLSCPNIKEGSAVFGTDPGMFRRCLEAVRAATPLPMIPKLAPNVSDIAEYARIAEGSGANAISLINSFPAMAVDIDTRRPKLANRTGGLSGPAIKPIAIRLVWLAAKAVKIPVVGIGGIYTPEDAIEFMMVGAAAVAVGTANFTDPGTAERVIDGIADFCRRKGMARAADLVGTVEA